MVEQQAAETSPLKKATLSRIAFVFKNVSCLLAAGTPDTRGTLL
ncbi:MAG: hypothetical protein ACOX1X_08875 [Dethiobacteria bacterium]